MWIIELQSSQLVLDIIKFSLLSAPHPWDIIVLWIFKSCMCMWIYMCTYKNVHHVFPTLDNNIYLIKTIDSDGTVYFIYSTRVHYYTTCCSHTRGDPRFWLDQDDLLIDYVILSRRPSPSFTHRFPEWIARFRRGWWIEEGQTTREATRGHG